MKRIAKRAALSVLAVSLLSASAIGAEEQKQDQSSNIQVGQGVVCDTAQQVERLTSLMAKEGGVATAIKTVNDEAKDPRACGMVMAAFIRGDEVGEVRNAAHALKVVEITILAVPVNNQWHFVSPLKQYTAFPLKGIEV